ncbi:hypothetical protein Amet_4682 [Alkaliphilus metalliredigens QYMF]|uniref:DUF4367 domain-containing protein n=1 Tax=Alkaliphilus metalliredigens (strain QYMF) TaxID=293826 RepID=A6TX32_ALKMQ|nr:hypothetical protein [Alkaliphilus metalliredigens]ABR50750.1 hypothetical protein Amet_4682 [Alkaliphilus metalliredigens QYMF]
MRKDKLDQLDTLITEVLEEEMNAIDITDEEIEQQWLKLQEKSKKKKIPIKTNYKRAAIIIIGVLSGFTLLNLADIEISAWKIPGITNILNASDKGSSIEHNLSVGGGLEVLEEERILTNSIEEVRHIVSFNFKELPYQLEDALIEGPFDGAEILDLNYTTNQGRISLQQMRQGLEFTQSINVNPTSEILEILLDNIPYTIVKVTETHTKVVWSSFGINHTMDIFYAIEIEEVKEIIKAME